MTCQTATSPPPESSTEEIDRQRINPDEARTHFLSPDERNQTSATRIASKRKAYRPNGNLRDKDGSSSDDDEEEEEGLQRKVARLRREIAEVKGEVEKQKSSNGSKQIVDGEDTQEIESLSALLETMRPPSGFGGEHGAAARLAKGLAVAISSPSAPASKSVPSALKSQSNQNTDQSGTDAPTYASKYDPSHTLSKVTAFETRLSTLESALGIDSLPLPTQDRPTSKSLLPTLEILDRQLNVLTTSTDTTLDTLSRRVRQLTSDAQSLKSAREAAAKASNTSTTAQGSNTSGPSIRSSQDPQEADIAALSDPENVSKIHALYGTLPTIDALAPLLPATLDRLRSLRALHADAGTANQTLTRVEERQQSVREEIREWREGLEKMEKAVAEGASRMKGNTDVVESWVKELEGRMERLGAVNP